MRGPREKSSSSRRTAAKHATRSVTAAVAPQSEFIVVESAPHRRPRPMVGSAEQQKALLLRSPANGNNGEPEVNRQRRESQPPCGARRSTRNDIEESKCIEVQENGRLTTPPPAIVFKSAPSPYKSNPFRLAVAIKVKYASKFTGAIVASRPRGCEYEYRYRSGSPR